MARATASIGIRLESTAIVRPGDTLVVAVDHRTTAQQAADLADQIEERLPGVKAIVLTANSLAVYQPDAEGDQR